MYEKDEITVMGPETKTDCTGEDPVRIYWTEE
jgi:hypothetical protein